MKKFFYGVLLLMAATMFAVSCSKDDDDDKKSDNQGGATATYCWDFMYQGSVLTSQCGLTEAEAEEVVKMIKQQGYTVTKKRQ